METRRILLKNAQLVNEGSIAKLDVRIDGTFISEVGENLPLDSNTDTVYDLEGSFLLPGLIDDQVHFREPGLTHKATLESESKAAAAGGITSFIEMPNTKPQTTTIEALEAKFTRAAEVSTVNFSFMFGGTNDNIEEILKLKKGQAAALKLFLGSSTGNMLVDNPETLEEIFSKTDLLIAVHCEDEATIRANTEKYKALYGDDIPIELHPVIRSEEACYKSSSTAIELARKTGARLHVFHLSTAAETELFDGNVPLEEKQITAEVCIHHLWFSDADYKDKKTLIKWNPAVKTAADRDGLWEALLDDRIDVIATDHAPHTLDEKQQPYTKAPSGGPLVQHALPALMEKYKEGRIPLETIVQKMCHNPAILFDIEKRGFIRPGYYADLVVVNPNSSWSVEKENVLYKCGWSPFEGTEFSSQVTHTFVNGSLVYNIGQVLPVKAGMRLSFSR